MPHAQAQALEQKMDEEEPLGQTATPAASVTNSPQISQRVESAKAGIPLEGEQSFSSVKNQESRISPPLQGTSAASDTVQPRTFENAQPQQLAQDKGYYSANSRIAKAAAANKSSLLQRLGFKLQAPWPEYNEVIFATSRLLSEREVGEVLQLLQGTIFFDASLRMSVWYKEE